MQNVLFWLFAGIAVCAAILVIFAKNPVRAVLSLILTFISTAVTWLMLDAEFLGITLILVYVGAVMVLFLFVVMMLDITFATIEAKFSRWLPIGLLVTAGIVGCLLIQFVHAKINFDQAVRKLSYAADASNTQLLGKLVFSKYLLQFEAAGVLLLVAIIAAIGLIYRGPQARKIQNISAQIDTQPKNRVRLVDGT
jgi:NADH-quinone oxidoreductase subunit J